MLKTSLAPFFEVLGAFLKMIWQVFKSFFMYDLWNNTVVYIILAVVAFVGLGFVYTKSNNKKIKAIATIITTVVGFIIAWCRAM